MRIARPLLMFSLSVFLLAVSWNLLTGEASVPDAVATQGAPVYDGPPIVYFTMLASGSAIQEHAVVVDEQGYVWSRNVDESSVGLVWQRLDDQILAPGTPIPTGTESMGSLKSQHGG